MALNAALLKMTGRELVMFAVNVAAESVGGRAVHCGGRCQRQDRRRRCMLARPFIEAMAEDAASEYDRDEKRAHLPRTQSDS